MCPCVVCVCVVSHLRANCVLDSGDYGAPSRDASANGTKTMKYLHTMVRITDVEKSLHFYRDLLGLKEVRRSENEKGRYTLIFLAPPGQEDAPVELTYNWD